ncbi:STM3941 family protein [Flavobacterium sp. NRK1]|uniref:STM3941 family protein n=1 Tax=Flavobacterium sp. NRK1 TaxID=2954929 RepID=UPI002093A3EF|nr:STM3941 family protein [Flavobacterium sp. NRK1]MCO6148408.1 hypothetical protein [Flavobacterium sp. NRK1]
MSEIILYKSPLRALRMIALTSLFVLPCIYFIFSGDNPKFIFWLFAGIFSLGYVVGFSNLFDRRPQIIINNKGIWDRRLKFETLLWDDIIKVYPFHVRTPRLNLKSHSFICLALKPEISKKRIAPKWVENFNRKVRAQKASISVSDIKVNDEKLLSAIKQLCAEQPENRAAIISKLNLK